MGLGRHTSTKKTEMETIMEGGGKEETKKVDKSGGPGKVESETINEGDIIKQQQQQQQEQPEQPQLSGRARH